MQNPCSRRTQLSTQYRITPRNLGSLELADICEADFWYLSKLKFQPPFNNFGAALFTDCQSMEEAMLGYYLEKDGKLPKQFAPFCDIKARVDVNKHWSKFGYMHESGVWLYGSPDEVLRRADDTVVIWDHKTAHPKTEQVTDRFKPQYVIQITGYGLIAEVGLKLGRVSGGALGYWDLQHQAVIDNPGKFIRDGMLWASFVPKVYAIEIDYSRIDKLLEEAIKIWQSKVPPEGRSGCRDCKKLAALFDIQASAEAELSDSAQKALWMSGNDPLVRRSLLRHIEDRKALRRSALHEIQDFDDSLCFDDGGIAANWEFPGTTAY
jgi:hypothetical protein